MLFAALSYAVTQSSRGAGDISKEKLDLSISQMLQSINYYKTEINRQLIQSGDNGLSVDFSSINVNSFFHPDNGIMLIDLPENVLGSIGFDWMLTKGNFSVNGSSLGTSQNDLLFLAMINEQTCERMNIKLHNISNSGFTLVFEDNSPDNYYQYLHLSNLVTSAIVASTNETFAVTQSPPACYVDEATNIYYIDIIKEN